MKPAGLSLVGKRRDVAAIPVEIADAVELWAREQGRHGTVAWVRIPGQAPVPQVRLTLKPDDPRLKAWQTGATTLNGAGERVPLYDEEPVETIELVEWDEEQRTYVPMDLMTLGAGGVRTLLERGNMWSGCGEFDSLQEAIVEARRRQKAETERVRQAARKEAQARASEDSRRYLGRGRTRNDRVPLIAGIDPDTE